MTITVSQLNNYIRGVVDIDGVLSDVSVRGEVTNLKRARDGWYFSLKDDVAAINCFCYESITPPETGSVAIAEGQVNFFIKSGNISLFVRRLTATDNTGAAYLRFVELRDKLKKEGLFDDERKKPVPRCCDKVGVVTSETGAVIHDIENVALRRQPFVNIILYPVKVQGQGAAQEIAQGIEYFSNTDVDVVIVGRGGGSNEDLSAFNDELVVRAVANSVKPVVSAVGHGVDYTLCDFAADRRAVTPSEAAEFVTIDVASVKSRIRNLLSVMENKVSSKLQLYCDKVSYIIKNVDNRVDYSFEQAKNQIQRVIEADSGNVSHRVEVIEQRLNTDISRLNSLNPLNVLQRGYAYVTKNENVVKSINDVSVGDDFNLTLSDGFIAAQVLSKEKK